MSVFRKIIVSILALQCSYVGAECSMETPETTLKCYDEFIRDKNLTSLKTIYWDLKSFHFSNDVLQESEYKIVDKKTYLEDLDLGSGGQEIPIWAKKGNVELVSEKTINNQKGTYSHTFRKMDGKWYMVGHYGHGSDDFIGE